MDYIFSMIGTVYLLCDPSTELFKIGMTRGDVNKRIKELQTGNSCEIHSVKKFDTSIPSYIESSLHHHFFAKHALNEWYDLDLKDIIDFEKKNVSFMRTLLGHSKIIHFLNTKSPINCLSCYL